MVHSNPDKQRPPRAARAGGEEFAPIPAAPIPTTIGTVSRVIAIAGHIAACALLVMIAAQGGVVLARAVFGLSIPALQDLAVYLHAFAILIGLPVALMRDAHVRIAPRAQTSQWIEMSGSLCLTLPFAALLTMLAWPYAWRSWIAREGSADPDGLGGVYVIKFAIVAAGVFLVLVALAKGLSALRTLGARR